MFYIPPDQLRFWRGDCIARRFQQSKHHITLEESSKSTILLFILFAGEKPSQFSTPNCPLKVFIFLKTFSCFQGVQSLSRRGFFTRTYGPFHCFPTGVSQLGVVLPSRAGVFWCVDYDGIEKWHAGLCGKGMRSDTDMVQGHCCAGAVLSCRAKKLFYLWGTNRGTKKEPKRGAKWMDGCFVCTSTWQDTIELVSLCVPPLVLDISWMHLTYTVRQY